MCSYITFFSMGGLASQGDKDPSIAFFYGQEPPVDTLSQFDWVVIQPDQLSRKGITSLKENNAEPFAYISIGEGHKNEQGDLACGSKTCQTLGKNHDWNSTVADLSDPNWHDYIVHEQIGKLWERGFRAFFLDTMDSYQAYAQTEKDQKKQQDELVTIIQKIHDEYPEAKLFVNRGFEILPRIHDEVSAVAAESLYRKWNPKDKQYEKVPEEDTKWLLNQLDTIKQEYGLLVSVIDYLPPDQRQEARQLSKKIYKRHGFIPWIGTANLDSIGVGLIEPEPRKILMLYSLPDDNQDDDDEPAVDISEEPINALAAMPLEYMGYVPVYHNIKQPLPRGVLKGRYAGIVTWFNTPIKHKAQAYRQWLKKQLEDSVPVAMIGDPGIPLDGKLLNLMGLKIPRKLQAKGLEVTSFDNMLGFETDPPQPSPRDKIGFIPQKNRKDICAHLWLRDGEGTDFSPVLTGSWGGLVLSPWSHEDAPKIDADKTRDDAFGTQSRWILNPFKFFSRALNLKTMPIVDTTTENGNRIATAHIDGDGFANRATMRGTPFSGQTILEQVLEKYKFPTTASIIEGEISSVGKNAKHSAQLEDIARDTFEKSYVEIASHTFSHPFEWQKTYEGMESGKYNLDIPGYKVDYRREIEGSVAYIDNNLAPPGKKTKMILWSGDAIPPEKIIAITEELGLAHMNGGDTDINKGYESLTNVTPMIRPAGSRTQVYAPIINDNVFTNEFTGPFWGFSKVMQTFKLTESPRRLKPMTIYYHYFSGTRPSSIKAIQQAYEYVLDNSPLPMFESEYYEVVKNFQHVKLARTQSDDWLITGARKIRTIRLPRDTWPVLSGSNSVIGVNSIEQGNYVSLTDDNKKILKLTQSPPTIPYVKRANGRISHFNRDENDGFQLHLKARIPLQVELANTQKCRIKGSFSKKHELDNSTLLIWEKAKEDDISVTCK